MTLLDMTQPGMTAVLRGGGTTITDTSDGAGEQALPVIEFPSPIPGFPRHRRFVLVRMADDGLLFTLRSVDTDGPRLLVVPPTPFFPDYAPEIGEQAVEQLGTVDPADLLVLLVVTVPDEVADATVNLLAPVIVDRVTRRAVQVVLDEDLPIRAPLLAR